MKSLIFIFVFCLLLPGFTQANVIPDIIINEVAWMGTKASYGDEWIELFNRADEAKNIDGWVLKAADGSLQINLTGVIPAQSFWLLERTDDNSVMNINADQIYTGALNNNGETLELYDDTGKLIDSAAGSNAWPAGDNATKQTMERKDFRSWQTSQSAGGTPKSKNSAPAEETTHLASPPSSLEQSKKADDQKKPEEDNFSEDLAAVGEPIRQAQGKQIYEPLFPFLMALVVALFSGTIILMLKKRLK